MLCQHRGASVSEPVVCCCSKDGLRTLSVVFPCCWPQRCFQDCWNKGETLFATLPHECGPVRSSTVEVVSGVNAIAVGSKISVSSSGELTLVPEQDSVWMLRLEGVVIPMRSSDWGWSLVSKLVVALGLYASGGVLLARSRGSALVLRSHPHWGLWMQLQSLCADGVSFARTRASGQVAQSKTELEKQHKAKRDRPTAKAEGPNATHAIASRHHDGRWVRIHV